MEHTLNSLYQCLYFEKHIELNKDTMTKIKLESSLHPFGPDNM
jgi:hypothetical protein